MRGKLNDRILTFLVDSFYFNFLREFHEDIVRETERKVESLTLVSSTVTYPYKF